jgi:phenylacetate-coenzyme A ligase PaaK-like adenylate-forming protein
MSPWQRFRDDVQVQVLGAAADELARLTWSHDRIEQAQREGLRRLLTHAAEYSPFHRDRLAGIAVGDIEPDDLSALPVMTKAQMMDALDDVFTDRRLDRRVVDSALTATRTEPAPILDDYVALASGGCSGRRGVFVLDRAAVVKFIASVARQPGPTNPLVDATGGPPVLALVASPSAIHATGLLAALMSEGSAPARSALVPATRPVAEIIEQLNALQPAVLSGYASILVRLAAEASSGRLRIAPRAVSSTSETLLPEMRAAIREAFGAPVLDGFGSTEGLFGKTCSDDDVFVFNTDLCIVELVDADNHPVAAGEPSAKVLVTNLYNLTQPLIRYELTDTFIRQPDSVDHGYLRARVHGRNDDVLHYGAVDVHPIAIRSVMVKTPAVIDYQVRQTGRGIDVLAIVADDVPVVGLSDRLCNALVESGLPSPEVTVRLVERLDRHPVTGKLRRFIPLGVA